MGAAPVGPVRPEDVRPCTTRRGKKPAPWTEHARIDPVPATTRSARKTREPAKLSIRIGGGKDEIFLDGATAKLPASAPVAAATPGCAGNPSLRRSPTSMNVSLPPGAVTSFENAVPKVGP